MITIKCARCKRRLLRYAKMKRGRVLHCYKDRISKDWTVRVGDEVRCECGNVIGVDEGRWIKMRQGSFIHTGTIPNQGASRNR